MKVLTIDEVIGANLKDLIESEGLTVEHAAEALAALTGQTWSEVKVWRWESGNYKFKATDLFLLSRVFGRNVIAFLDPPDEVGTKNNKEEVTHVIVDETTYTVKRYRLDYLLDPRGSFVDRATDLTARHKAAAEDVSAALDDIRANLGERARLADFHSALKRINQAISMVETARDKAIEDPTPENIAEYKAMAEVAGDWWKEATKDIEPGTVLDMEGNANGVNHEEHK